MKSKNLETLCLNGLKGIGACIIAFMWHYQHFINFDIRGPFYRFLPLSFKYGYLMVEVFFILSGFGMMLGYSQKILKHRISFKDYIFRRFKKIYPLFFITLILTSIFEFIHLKLYGSTFIYPNFDLQHFILNVLCIHDGIFDTSWSFNSPSWFISVCIVLYCILYYIVYHSKNNKEVFYKFIFILCLSQILKDCNILNDLLYRGISSFSIGVIISYIYIYKDKFNYKLVGIIMVIFLFISFIVIRFLNTKYIGNLDVILKFGLAPCLILGMLFNKVLNFIFRLKPLVLLGNISMEIYLFHFPMQCIIKIFDAVLKLNINYYSKITWIIYVVGTVLIAFIYHNFISKLFTEKLINLFKNKKLE